MAASSRKKVQLAPGHTLADWYRLVQSGEDLGGAPRALRIPIEEVKFNYKKEKYRVLRDTVLRGIYHVIKKK